MTVECVCVMAGWGVGLPFPILAACFLIIFSFLPLSIRLGV